MISNGLFVNLLIPLGNKTNQDEAMNKLKEIVFKLKSSLTNTYAINDLEHKVKQHVSFELMRQKMIDSVLTNREKGIIEESADGERYVVSLTTHGERIEKVFQAIESVFLQSRKANKVVLYLSEDEFLMKELPITLEKQVDHQVCQGLRTLHKTYTSLARLPRSEHHYRGRRPNLLFQHDRPPRQSTPHLSPSGVL